MSDDISIPQAGQARTAYVHSYRSRRHGLDAGTKRLMLAAGGIGIVLVGGMAVWTFAGHRAGGPVPTVAADSRPLRVKPPEGSATPLASLVDGAPVAATDLAPGAEQPDPQALLAQRQQRPPAAPAAAAPPAAPPVTPVATSPAAAGAAQPAVAARTGLLVQLAAVDSEKAATSEWERLARRMPDLLGGRQSVVQKAEAGGKPVWRVRTGGFATVADATQFCLKVKSKGAGCSLATF